MEGPPHKRRRFFADTTVDPVKEEADPSSSKDVSSSEPENNGATEASSRSSTEVVFDLETFRAFAGEDVPVATFERIRRTSGNDLQKAINIYLDGSWQGTAQPQITSLPTRTTTVTAKEAPRPAPNRRQAATARYVGSFGVNAWATRTTSAVLKHGETIRIERAKIQATKAPKAGSVSKLTGQADKSSTAASRRGDVITRFTNAQGQEIGRIPKDIADWVSVLIDQGIWAPERIRSNDSIFLQLRCSLLRSAFESRGFQAVDDNRTTTLFEEKETAQEKDLRLRQIALMNLFKQINLVPTRSSRHADSNTITPSIQDVETEHSTNGMKPMSETSAQQSDDEDGKELDQDQLDTLYKKVKTFDFHAPASDPAETFTMDLRNYQKQALHWMLSKEKDEKDESVQQSMHPLWEEYTWPATDADGEQCSVHDSDPAQFYINPYSGELSLDFPLQEQHCLGGILADEMGLGKTIEMMSLIHTHRSPTAIKARNGPRALNSVNGLTRLPTSNAQVESAPCTTLVVAPMSLLSQWQSEAERSSRPGTMQILVYYGNEKASDLQSLCCEANASAAPDIIITSYGVVLSEFNQVASAPGSRGFNGGLFSLNFFRIILDEAHHIKNRSSKTARACYELLAEHRWVLTGTPIVNRLEDLFSLVRFLRVEPWSNFSFWKTFITVPFESKDFMRALDVVQTVLEPLVLRRTKEMKTPSGEALVPLPPRTIDIFDIELSTPERDVYNHIYKRAKRTFAANVEAGTVLKAYTSIFAQIMRLRQSCCHPLLTRNQDLVADEEDAAQVADVASGLADDMDLQNLIARFAADSGTTDGNAFGVNALQQIQDGALSECPICSEEPMIDQTVTGCWHSACKKCVLDYIAHQTDTGELPRCFTCRAVLVQRDIFEVLRDAGHPEATPDQPKITLQRLGTDSAKILALSTELKKLRLQDSTIKSVVFSQFTSFLSLIEPALERASIPFLRLDGSMAQKARAAVLANYAASKKGLVLLLSLRAGGVGLNLTMASRVFMMDPWWSFAIEAQAIDRVHRMGQVADVKVCRFIVKDSVEERMLRIQEKKKFLATSLGMMSDEEKKLSRIEDIRELLS